MSLPTSTRQWLVTNKPTDTPELSGPNQTFTLQTASLPPVQEDQVLLKSLFLSNDPAQRGWITKDVDPARLYIAPVAQDAVMVAGSVAQVLESKSSKFSKGDKVLAPVGWAEYCVLSAEECQPCEEIPGLSVTHYLGAFGMPGITAYYGTKVVARAGEGDTVVVSGAAGAVGSMVVQIAKKMLGCKRVIGIAGSEGKCRWVESLGADVCLNYKKASFKEDLFKETEGFVEVFFDNVGGEILDLMLTRLKRWGRVAACGAITDYNSSEKSGLKNWYEIISNRIEVRGFIIFDFLAEGKGPEVVKQLVTAVKEGKIKVDEENETVVETKFEDIPKTWMLLFEGANTGKLITKLV